MAERQGEEHQLPRTTSFQDVNWETPSPYHEFCTSWLPYAKGKRTRVVLGMPVLVQPIAQSATDWPEVQGGDRGHYLHPIVREARSSPAEVAQRKTDIPHPTQCTVKVTPETKTEDARREAEHNNDEPARESTNRIDRGKAHVDPAHPKPDSFEKIGFKIDPVLFQSLQGLAARTQSNVQSLIRNPILSINKSSLRRPAASRTTAFD